MTSIPRDNNRVHVTACLSNANGTTILPLYANVSNNSLKAIDALTGTDYGGNPAPRDENRIPIFMAVSAADGVTPVAIYADSITNSLLIRTT